MTYADLATLRAEHERQGGAFFATAASHGDTFVGDLRHGRFVIVRELATGFRGLGVEPSAAAHDFAIYLVNRVGGIVRLGHERTQSEAAAYVERVHAETLPNHPPMALLPSSARGTLTAPVLA